MELEKDVLIVNGISRWSDDWPRNVEDVLVVNNLSRDDMPLNYQNVRVINGLSLEDRPRRYDNIRIINGISRMSDDWPLRYEDVYIENFGVIKSLPSVRKVFYPSIMFLQCNWCFKEFESAISLNQWYRCPHCGHDFHEIQSVSK